jgi:hypothetical protein
MALRAWASFTRLDKLTLIPRGACSSLPAGRQPGLSLRATKGDEARPAIFFHRAVRDRPAEYVTIILNRARLASGFLCRVE